MCVHFISTTVCHVTNVENFSIHTKGSLPPVSVGKLLFTSDIPNKNSLNQRDSYMPCTAMAHSPKFICAMSQPPISVTQNMWYNLWLPQADSDKRLGREFIFKAKCSCQILIIMIS